MPKHRTRKLAMQALFASEDFCGHDTFHSESLPTWDTYPPVHHEALICNTCGKEYAISWGASYDNLHTVHRQDFEDND